MFETIYYSFIVSPFIPLVILIVLMARKKAKLISTLICLLYPFAVIATVFAAGICYYNIPVAYSAGQPEPTAFVIIIDEVEYFYVLLDENETFPKESELKPIARSRYPENIFSASWAKEILFAPRYTTLKNGNITDIYYYCEEGKYRYTQQNHN